jgi:hypothetical protein
MNQLTTVLVTLPLLIAISVQGESCGSTRQPSVVTKNAAVQQEGRMTKGIWGGDHISLEVTDDGAQVEYDCAHGTISEPLRVDTQGKFSAKGTHFRERGGPQRADAEDKGEPVIYSGTTDGKTATFTITNSITDEVIGTFAITLGKKSRIVKCL